MKNGKIWLSMLLIAAATFPAFAQVLEKKDSVSSIPSSVMQLIKPACMTCHSDQGRDKPKNAVNFSTWDQYRPVEKKFIAGSIVSELTKESMPPKRYLQVHPEAALTAEQIKTLIQWCDSIRTK
ncbi:MAG: heme-binding domain-containing protein [Marinilabiliales bacterium]|nr:heme-binding domain-containing protein [Marinilabiliales bacterium]